jgi:hypothetical protein
MCEHHAETTAIKQEIAICPLPSTSAANARWKLDEPVQVWRRIYQDGSHIEL